MKLKTSWQRQRQSAKTETVGKPVVQVVWLWGTISDQYTQMLSIHCMNFPTLPNHEKSGMDEKPKFSSIVTC